MSSHAYFFHKKTSKGNRVLLFIYMKKSWFPWDDTYMTSELDNYVDSPMEVNETKLESILDTYPPLYDYTEYTPEELHKELHGRYKLTKFYSKKWFEKQYAFIHNQFG